MQSADSNRLSRIYSAKSFPNANGPHGVMVTGTGHESHSIDWECFQPHSTRTGTDSLFYCNTWI